MAKKKEAFKPKTFKTIPKGDWQGLVPEPVPEGQSPAALEVTVKDKPGIIAELLKVEGMNQELAERMAAHGIPGDSYVVQTFYRVSAVTADAVIKVFQEVKK